MQILAQASGPPGRSMSQLVFVPEGNHFLSIRRSVMLQILQKLKAQVDLKILIMTSDVWPFVGSDASIENLFGYICDQNQSIANYLYAKHTRGLPGMHLTSLLRGVVNTPAEVTILFRRASFHRGLWMMSRHTSL